MAEVEDKVEENTEETRESAVAQHRQYVEEHPEIRELMNDFMTACLMERPSNVFGFAETFFRDVTVKKMATRRPIVVCGPSGVGKGTLIGRIMQIFPQGFGFSVSHTTRQPRPGEEDGIHYHFTTVETMREEIAAGAFIEHAEVHGNFYGTSKAAVDSVAGVGKICILDIDVQGVKSVKESSLDPHYLFIAPPKALESKEESLGLLEERLRGRGTETEEKIQKRMANAAVEMDYGLAPGNMERTIVNDNLDAALDEFRAQLLGWYPHLENLEAKEA